MGQVKNNQDLGIKSYWAWAGSIIGPKDSTTEADSSSTHSAVLVSKDCDCLKEGGDGSGCRGDNCGRKKGGAQKNNIPLAGKDLELYYLIKMI